MEPINIRLVDLGVINGIHIFEVYDANTNEKIGYNEIPENFNLLNTLNS